LFPKLIPAIPCSTLDPIPILALGRAGSLELVDVFSSCVAEPLCKVVAVAIIISLKAADFRGHCIIFGIKLVWVSATVCVVSARGYHGSKRYDS
jgi:hypothetical protein